MSRNQKTIISHLLLLLVVVVVVELSSSFDKIILNAEGNNKDGETYGTKTTTTTTTSASTQVSYQHKHEQHDQHEQQQHLHPPLLVDTRYWIRDTEFGEQDNWRNKLKPCTLLERISMSEQAVVSMGDSLDSLGGGLEANIKELTLSQNGMLLLEEDSFSDPIDPMFIQYLNESGDCLDYYSSSSTTTTIHSKNNNNNNAQEEQMAAASSHEGVTKNLMNTQQAVGHLFHFEPDQDHMSWFNPDNWLSSLNEEEIVDWIPDSHSIPCGEDVVVFGSRLPTIDSNERGRVLSFKVNFEPSSRQLIAKQANAQTTASETGEHQTQSQTDFDTQRVKINHLRVSKLKIGDLYYSQHDFEQLLKSQEYENILFKFNSSRSLLQVEEGFHYPPHSLLVIDESSLLADTNFDLCLDEAGCLCGNEQTNIMKAICSFSLPINQDEQPCDDPISSSGFCNKICATSITITMDPTRFKERYLLNTVNKLYTNGEQADYFAEAVFITIGRRTYDNMYEITFRPIPADLQTYEITLGREIEFAQLVLQELDKSAIRSFYGINTVSVKSSVNWRRSNQLTMFIASLPVWLVLVTIVFSYRVVYNSRIDKNSDEEHGPHTNWIFDAYRFITQVGQEVDETDPFLGTSDKSIPQANEQISTSSSAIALVELDNGEHD